MCAVIYQTHLAIDTTCRRYLIVIINNSVVCDAVCIDRLISLLVCGFVYVDFYPAHPRAISDSLSIRRTWVWFYRAREGEREIERDLAFSSLVSWYIEVFKFNKDSILLFNINAKKKISTLGQRREQQTSRVMRRYGALARYAPCVRC